MMILTTLSQYWLILLPSSMKYIEKITPNSRPDAKLLTLLMAVVMMLLILEADKPSIPRYCSSLAVNEAKSFCM